MSEFKVLVTISSYLLSIIVSLGEFLSCRSPNVPWVSCKLLCPLCPGMTLMDTCGNILSRTSSGRVGEWVRRGLGNTERPVKRREGAKSVGGSFPGWAWAWNLLDKTFSASNDFIRCDLYPALTSPLSIYIYRCHIIFVLMCKIIDERMGGVKHQDNKPEPGWHF